MNQSLRRSIPWARGSRPLILAGLAGALGLLVLNIRNHAFLTDDAFIAFRYARNLSLGHGLVFNPGHEAVEGYTSLLWVLVLALLDRLGVAPERAANVLSITATFVLWAMVLRFCARRPGAARTPWLLLLPAFGLAVNRSFGVWATGGLETRAFETFAVGGLLRLVEEQEREDRGEHSRSLAPWWFLLACLTRPEGTVVTFTACAAHAWWRARTGRLEWSRLAREWLPGVLAPVALTLFRLAYYHDWLPNTWYAKVGGESFWGTGARYLAAFALEYAVWMWIPLLAAVAGRSAGRGFLPLASALVLGPHLLFVAAVGGDHFEYRPLGLEVVLGFVLLHEGATALADPASPGATPRRRRRIAVAAWAALLVLATTVIPRASHRQFPAGYRTGFPGAQLESPEGEAFLDPARDPITALPGLATLAGWHRDLTRNLTSRLVAVRHEEHQRFLAAQADEGHELAALIERGLLPRDLHVAIDCVGAIPYYSSLRTLDRLGLTDARVARSPRAGGLMAHWRFASLDYARERGVDLWADDRVHLICSLDSRILLRAYNGRDDGVPRYVADLGGDRFLLCQLPMGLEAARRRMPRLEFGTFDDPAFTGHYLTRLARAWRDSLSDRPDNPLLAGRLARLLAALGDHHGAIRLLQGLIANGHGPVAVWEMLAEYQAVAGQPDSARASLLAAFREAERAGDADFLERWRLRGHPAQRGLAPDSAWRPGTHAPDLVP